MMKHNRKISASTIEDSKSILELYEIATVYMGQRSNVVWPVFERSMVEDEINNKKQWKLTINGKIACIWAITFNDAQIWESKNEDPSLYIHRIAVDPNFRGKKLVKYILKWAIGYSKQIGLKYIRLDTVGNNTGLIKHYTDCGFTYLGLHPLKNTNGLPKHYENASVSLFEYAIEYKWTDFVRQPYLEYYIFK